MQENRQETVENEVGMQEDTQCMAERREKGEHEENNQKIEIEACEWKFNSPAGADTEGLMKQMNVAWHRISGSPLLPAGFDRKVSISKPQPERGLIIISLVFWASETVLPFPTMQHTVLYNIQKLRIQSSVLRGQETSHI